MTEKPVRLLTAHEAAEFLSVSTRTVQRLVKEKKLAAIKVRGSIRFCFNDLLRYTDENRWF